MTGITPSYRAWKAGTLRTHETRRRLVTALYCDLVGSTEFGERLDDETVPKVLDRYVDAMRWVIYGMDLRTPNRMDLGRD